MVYRAVGLELTLNNLSAEDEIEAEKVARNLTFTKMINLSKHPDFRSDVGGQAASKVAALPVVRNILLKMQQDFA
jgi:cytidylate kinase